MKDYTVIYGEFNQTPQYSITKFKHITCEPENLIQTIEQSVCNITAVWFVFDKHCKQSEN